KTDKTDKTTNKVNDTNEINENNVKDHLYPESITGSTFTDTEDTPTIKYDDDIGDIDIDEINRNILQNNSISGQPSINVQRGGYINNAFTSFVSRTVYELEYLRIKMRYSQLKQE